MRNAICALVGFGILFSATPLSAGLPDTSQAAPAKAGEIRTLADLLPQAAWDINARSPLLIVDPAGTGRVGQRTSRVAPPKIKSPVSADLPAPGPDGRRNLRSSLAAFDRILVPVGALSVVAPREMVLISETPPKRKPNLWEGMRPDEKLLYILSTLSAGQWAMLGGKEGIGASDLSGEARAAFLSLLPARFAYREGIVDKNGFIPDSKPVGLSASQWLQVRLRMSLSPSFQIPTGDSCYSQTLLSFLGMPGDRAAERDNEGESDRTESYGITMQTRAPNRAKPSDLASDSPVLRRSVTLSDAKTVSDLVVRAGAAAGLDLHADFRVAGLPVATRGGSARAGDLLKGLALAVCGTWRRVGDAESKTFVLTSDRIGAGTRRLRLADWQADLEAEKQRQVTAWRSAITKTGHFARVIGYAPDDPLAPKGALADRFAASEKGGRQGGSLKPENLIPRSELTPAMQEQMRQFFAMYKDQAENQGWNQNGVQISRSIVARFVLPDGQTLSGYENLSPGSSDMLESAASDPDDYEAREQAALEKYLKTVPQAAELPMVNMDGLGASLFLAAGSPGEGTAAAATARRFGFTELYLKTDKPEVAAAALEAAKGGRLAVSAVAPLLDGAFAAEVPDADRDRNLLGETGGEAALARLGSARWKVFYAYKRRQQFPRPTEAQLAGLPGDALVPGSHSWENRREALVRLAATPGLAGIAFVHPAPPGYAGARSPSIYGGTDFPFTLRSEMGYSPAMRRAFLLKEGVDPLDLIPQNLRFAADLRQPFFLDDNARGESTVYDGRDTPAPGFTEKNAAWDAFRGQQAVATLRSLRRDLEKASPKLPVRITPLPSMLPNGGTPGWLTFLLWPRSDAPLPRLSERGGITGSQTGAITPFPLPKPRAETDLQYHALQIRGFLEPPVAAPKSAGATPPRLPFALDLSDMPLSEAEALLAKSLRPVPK